MEHIWKYEDYSQWSQSLARTKTVKELESEKFKSEKSWDRINKSHSKVIDKSSSMSSNSWRRASYRTSMQYDYEYMNACKNALEIHKYYPDKCKIWNT
jgi:hypothetical protein